MNERDVAEVLITVYGRIGALARIEAYAVKYGLDSERITTLINHAQVKVTWND